MDVMGKINILWHHCGFSMFKHIRQDLIESHLIEPLEKSRTIHRL